jgi:hypothetical protein
MPAYSSPYNLNDLRRSGFAPDAPLSRDMTLQSALVRCGNNFVGKLAMDLVPTPMHAAIAADEVGQFPSANGSR